MTIFLVLGGQRQNGLGTQGQSQLNSAFEASIWTTWDPALMTKKMFLMCL